MKRTILLCFVIFASLPIRAQSLPIPESSGARLKTALRYSSDKMYSNNKAYLSSSAESGSRSTRGSYMLSSLILPGWGERRMGESTRGTILTSTEVTLWLGYLGLTAYSDWRERDFKAYAADHAGINTANKNGQYWVDLGGYDNINEFNDDQLRNRLPDRIYNDITTYHWDWPNRAIRVQYDRMRIQSRAASKYATFAIGAMVVNRIISALDVNYLYNTRLSADNSGVAYTVLIPFH